MGKAYLVDNRSEISSESILVDIFAEKVIFSGNHDFGGGATGNDTKRIPKVNISHANEDDEFGVTVVFDFG